MARRSRRSLAKRGRLHQIAERPADFYLSAFYPAHEPDARNRERTFHARTAGMNGLATHVADNWKIHASRRTRRLLRAKLPRLRPSRNNGSHTGTSYSAAWRRLLGGVASRVRISPPTQSLRCSFVHDISLRFTRTATSHPLSRSRATSSLGCCFRLDAIRSLAASSRPQTFHKRTPRTRLSAR